MKFGLIYRAISPSGKFYIGQTICSLGKRKKQHKRDSIKISNKFYFAIKKYGFDNFIWETLYEQIPLKYLNIMETWMIASYDSYAHGYNSTPGGVGLHVRSTETRIKLSEARLGKTHSKETKRKISNTKKEWWEKQNEINFDDRFVGTFE